MLHYTLNHTDGLARQGTLRLNHGEIETPIFMPVGTYGAVKGMSPADLEAVGARIILGNTFHLWLAASHPDRFGRLPGLEPGGSAQDLGRRRALCLAHQR